MKEWWLSLDLREKRMVAAGAVVVLAGLLYGLIWSPLHNTTAALRERIRHNQQLLAWMQSADQQIKAAETINQTPVRIHSAASWLSIIQNDLNHSALAKNISQLVQTNNDSVKLSFQQVDFDLLIFWLTELWQQENLIVTQFSIIPGNTPGIVKAEFILRPA